MRLLLDTHTFLWFISGDRRLPSKWREVIQDPSNEVYLSVVSLWEIIVKYHLGKLPLPESPDLYLPRQRERHRIASLALDELSVARLARLPPLHRDPFDRMLVCQALHHDLALVTLDDAILAYDVARI
ncbi:MAG TPA: type II toxin-antitoxin system VapC family toxin [Thermoanaerobaculia bacterium]|jgi:PIN domain nuclease of toxin-antitoxin system